jgi:hypothetical protein
VATDREVNERRSIGLARWIEAEAEAEAESVCDADATLARHPSFLNGKNRVDPEYFNHLLTISFTGDVPGVIDATHRPYR